jgi:hypothetical protein
VVLRQLQDLLAGIYDVPLPHDVAHFLMTDRSALPPEHRASETDEQLLVAEEHDGIALGLFLEPEVLARLSAANPLESLHGGNLADYWTALEGVSHFVYLAWNAGHDRPVSLHELELQAEVDKYVCSLWLLRAQDPTRFPAELHRVLFERARVDAGLAGERVDLYHRANRHAARFCQRLARLLRPRGALALRAATAELRRFYRLTNAGKLRHIEGMA